MIRLRILHVTDQQLAQILPVENIDSHGSKIALRVLRLLFKLYDIACLIRIHDPEAARFLDRHRTDRDRRVRSLINVRLQHLVIVHLIDVVAGQDQKIFRIILVNKINILGNRISSAAVDIQSRIRFLPGRQDKHT